MKTIIIQGSSRTDGNTAILVQELSSRLNADVVHLANLNIGHYDYEYRNLDDDFLPLIRKIANEYDRYIFVTPVYWYSMSGMMKAFFDRLSDCIRIEKETGRKLRGKSMAAVSSSEDSTIYPSLFEAFRLSAGYLGMTYLTDAHIWIDGDGIAANSRNKVEEFIEKLSN